MESESHVNLDHTNAVGCGEDVKLETEEEPILGEYVQLNNFTNISDDIFVYICHDRRMVFHV